MADYNPQFLALCDSILKKGSEKLKLPTGIVSRTDDPFYTVVAVISPTVVFQRGDSFSLVDTYCREVCHTESTVAYTHYSGEPGLRKHPLYIDMPIEAYISSPIMVDGKVWGTINFSDTKMRSTPFSEDEILYLESLADTLAAAIT